MKVKCIVDKPNQDPYIEEMDMTGENLSKLLGGRCIVYNLATDMVAICKDQRHMPGYVHYGSIEVQGTVIYVGRNEEGYCDVPISLKEFKKNGVNLQEAGHEIERDRAEIIRST